MKNISTQAIIETLRDLNLLRVTGHGYLPVYQISDISMDLENIYNFNLDTQIIDTNKIKKDSRSKKVRTIVQ